MILPDKDSPSMELFLEHFSKTIPHGRHALLIVDQGRMAQSFRIKGTPKYIICFLPPYSPELNPIEQLWRHLKQRWFLNRCYKDYDEIINFAVKAWNLFTALTGAIKKLCSRPWVTQPRQFLEWYYMLY